jgi:DNA-binding beta-propeller fold protein YncE
MSSTLRRFSVLLILVFPVLFILPGSAQVVPVVSFQPGDILISLEPGPVQWRRPDGSLRAVLIPTVVGTGEGMAFDRSGNLYVTRWAIDSGRMTGNTVEKYNTLGLSLGSVGSGYDCDPHAIVFDATGNLYVGQAACSASILKFGPAGSPLQLGSIGSPTAEFRVAPDTLGAFWIDLAADGCTMFYTSWGPNVKRFDVCGGVQLPDFNGAAVPGGEAQDLRALPDGGVLVSSGQVVARLDAGGALVRTYQVQGEEALWAGLDLVGNGAFWAGNYRTSNVYKFDLATGQVLAGFNTGTEPNTVVGIRVKK